jgi:replicative DNA helicase
MLNIEQTILSNLIYNEDYARKVIVFLKGDYFQSNTDRIVFEEIQTFYSKYNDVPTKEALRISVEEREDLSSGDYEQSNVLVDSLSKEEANDQWLLDETEKFCKDKAVYNAIMESINIIDDKDNKKSEGSIPELLSEALAVSFDTHIGHDFLEDSEARYDYYQRKEERIPFDIEYLNKITKGGIPRKTLNILMAGTGVGKTIGMCHMAASNLTLGKNVLYITMEMAEERIAERIDANLMDVELDSLADMSFERYEQKMSAIKSTTKGKLIVKEFPTSTAHAGHFRHILKELALKKNFAPDIIYIDYLNICASQRLVGSNNVNSYTYVKAIAEELRGLAVEYNVPIWSATQVNRSGFSSSDMGLEDTSESFGLPATADLFLALIQTDELQDMNQIMVKQLKNRYGDENVNKRFVIGINKAKMKWYDVEDSAQADIMGSNTSNEISYKKEESIFSSSKGDNRKNAFKDFKV